MSTIRAGFQSALSIPHSAILLLLISGCSLMDPSVYQGYGTTPPPERPARATASAQPEPPAARLPFGATPPGGQDTAWGMPRAGDILAKSPDNVGIVVEKLDASALADTELGASFRTRSGNLAVAGGNPLAARNGLSVRLATGSFTGRIGLGTRRTRSTSREQMFIACRSGTEGALVMGGDVYVTRLGYWGPLGYVLLAEREFVGRQLAVRPTILPNGAIAVELWPRFSTRRGRFIDVTELATRVVVPDGQSLIVGGLNTSGSEVSSVLFGLDSRERSASSILVLTAKIGGLDLDWPKPR